MCRKIIIIIGLLLAGCAYTRSIPVGLDKTIGGLELDFKNMGYISYSDLLSANEANEKAVNEYVRKKQCLFNRPNPIIIMALGKMTLNLKGVVGADGSFKIAAVPTPSAEAGFTMSKETEQNISWPVMAISLAALPDVYYEAMLKSLCELKLSTELKMSDQDIKMLIKDIQKNKDTLKERIDKLQSAFDAKKHCK